MPLLRGQPFRRSTAADDLADDEEVFYCKSTGEIFKDYEEYHARIILVYSNVWTCEITGKKRLTYLQANRSEKRAWWALKRFPRHLRIALLYIARRTKMRRSQFQTIEEAELW